MSRTRQIVSLLLCMLLVACSMIESPTNQRDLGATVTALETAVALQPTRAQPASTPTSDPEATIAALQTTVADQQVQLSAATPGAELSPSPARPAASPAVTPEPTAVAPTVVIPPPSASAGITPTATANPVSAEGAAREDPTVFRPVGDGANTTTINIELVFDASGSMAEDIGGETKIEAARRAMNRVIDQLPDNAPNLNVGFRVFGHLGDNTEAQRELSCRSSELLVPVASVNKELLRRQVNAWEPTGWTPISLALQRAGEDLTAGENVRNVIIMVTDGEETCGGDPCAVAQALARSGAEVRIDVVGFGTTTEQDENLRCIAENTGGIFTNAGSGAALAQTLEELTSAAISRSYLRIKALDAQGQPTDQVKLVGITDQLGKPAVDSQGNPVVFIGKDGLRDSVEPLSDGETRVELLPGTYQIVVEYGLFTSGSLLGLGTAPRQVYTAIVEAGQETVAIVGIGELRLLNAGGLPDDYPCLLLLERSIDGTWQRIAGTGTRPCIRGARLDFDQPALLSPGRYRLLNAERGNQQIGAFAIVAGKQVTVRIQGR